MKSTMRYHLIPMVMDIVKNTKDDSLGGCGGQKTLARYQWECELEDSWKMRCRFLKKLKLELLYDTPNPLLCIYIQRI